MPDIVIIIALIVGKDCTVKQMSFIALAVMIINLFQGENKMTKTYQELAIKVQARLNCIKTENEDWKNAHESEILNIVECELPSGSGFDSGTHLDLEFSTSERLIFYTSYHFMDEMGGYDGWEDYKIVVTASLVAGVNVKVVGKNRDNIKTYIGDIFWEALWQDCK
jgi:hypothetical protein